MAGRNIIGQKLVYFIRRILDVVGRVKLVTVYAWVFFICIVVWAGSCWITNRILRNSIQSEYTEYNEALFEQAIADINRGIHDLVQISYTVMSDTNMNDFLQAQSFTERKKSLEGLHREFNRMRTIQPSIEAIKLYDLEGNLIASTGTAAPANFFQPSGSVPAISFHGPYEIEKRNYFGVFIPIYSVENSVVKGLNGYCSLLVDMSFLEKRLLDISDSEDGWYVLVNNDGGILLEKGERPAYLQSAENLINPENENAEAQLIYRRNISRAGWNIIFGVSEAVVFKGINSLHKISLMTGFLMGLLILILFIGIYASFLRPMRQQIQFMNYYAVNRQSRIKVRSHNEMGKLAENLNIMLDDMERLNDDNLEARRRMLDAEYQKKQSELLAYRNQINPHFLHNTFECIRGMALYYEVPDIAAISESLASFFTYNVRGKGYAPIREIREHVRDYASIISYRFMNRFRIECLPEEDVLDCVFPKMVIQPLVENAIFHGLEPIEGEGIVQVEIRKTDGYLCILVKDNGIGMDEETVTQLRMRLKEYDRTNFLSAEKHGIGMVNIYRRLRMFYGQDFTFFIESKTGCGTSIQIRVPAEERILENEDVPGIFN